MYNVVLYMCFIFYSMHISTFLSFVTFLPRTDDLHPPNKIPVLNDLHSYFFSYARMMASSC